MESGQFNDLYGMEYRLRRGALAVCHPCQHTSHLLCLNNAILSRRHRKLSDYNICYCRKPIEMAVRMRLPGHEESTALATEGINLCTLHTAVDI